MIRNLNFFQDPIAKESYLRARGFDGSGYRSGGLIQPSEVTLPPGTVLFRLYHDPKRRLGEWWSTPHEMKQVVEYFGRSGPAFAVGRPAGKGILHATLAIRHDWAGKDPGHLRQFVVIRLNEPLQGYHGEGDHAPDRTQTAVQKAVKIIDSKGVQRFVRQIFLPRPWEYMAAFTDLGHHPTDLALLGAVEKHRRAPLYFET
jgi:hypothetical protein